MLTRHLLLVCGKLQVLKYCGNFLTFYFVFFFQVVRAYWSDSSFVHQTPPEMSVNMQVIDPAGKVLKSAVNGQFENYRFNAAGEGAHKICLFSYYGNKNVYIRC